MLELVFRVCVRQRKKMGAGISRGGPPWAHEAGGRACYLLSTALVFLEEERVMQQSSVSISLSF